MNQRDWYRPSNGFSLTSTLFLAASLALIAAASSADIGFAFCLGLLSSLFLLPTASDEGAPLLDLNGFKEDETTGPGAGPLLLLAESLFSIIDPAPDPGPGFFIGNLCLESDEAGVAPYASSCVTHLPVSFPF